MKAKPLPPYAPTLIESTRAIGYTLRSQVSLITSQPDMTPVVIPAININALANRGDAVKNLTTRKPPVPRPIAGTGWFFFLRPLLPAPL